MSRCYPYPPPGYEKKAYVELGFSPKKEKHKHRDKEKKKKKRKDRETNGDTSRDAGKRSKKAQEAGVLNEGPSLPNGRTAAAIISVPVDEKFTQRLRAGDGLNASVLYVAGGLALSCKGPERVTLQESQALSVPIKAASSSRNGEAAVEAKAESSSKTSRFEPEFCRICHFSPCVENVWSAMDDQEWLFPRDVQEPKLKSEARDAPLAWAEAVFLPSVGIYSLPYVVPD